MAIKKEFHTISISIPSELVNISKGKVSSVKSLTKTGNLTTKEGKKSVLLETNKGNEVIVKNEGRTIDTKEEKKKAKDRKERAKNMSESELDKYFKQYKDPLSLIKTTTDNEIKPIIYPRIKPTKKKLILGLKPNKSSSSPAKLKRRVPKIKQST